MTTVHLSWFDNVYDWLRNDALDFIFDWVSGIFSEAGNWLIQTMQELLEDVMKSVFGDFINQLLEVFFFQMYTVLTTILMILDCIEDCFNIVSGLSPVYRESGNLWLKMPLLNAVFAEQSIQNTIAVTIGVGFSLCFLCAILGTVKSMFEMDGRNTKPVGHVMAQTGKAMLYFILVPLMAAFLISLSGAMISTVNKALTGDEGESSVARTIFAISALDAIDVEKNPGGKSYNSSYEGDKPSDFGITDRYRRHFYYKDDSELIPNYANPVIVKDYFTFRGIDYVVGFVMGVYFNIVLGMVLFIFVCRIFEVIVLIIVEPFFIATMPLDDGEHFKKWSELFIGKLFSGFGMVAAMKLYLIVVAAVFRNTISFVEPGSNGAAVQNYLIKLLFMAGGALGIKSIGPLITSLISWEAAQSEQEQAAVGAYYGNKIAGFQGQRVGKLLMRTGKPIGDAASSVLAGVGILGSRTAEGIGEGISRFGERVSGGSGKGRGADGKMTYKGGVPINSSSSNENRSLSPAKDIRGLSPAKDINNITIRTGSAASAADVQKNKENLSLNDMKNTILADGKGNEIRNSGPDRKKKENLSLNDMKNTILTDGKSNDIRKSGLDKENKSGKF